jgi:hypothetical protein
MAENPDRRWRPLTLPLAVTGVLSLIYLISAPLSADHAAQLFRTELFEQAGPVIWNNHWFGGHYLPTYSLLAPAIGSWVGFRLMGVAAVLGTVALFTLIVDRQWGEQARAGAIWFSAAATVSLYSGRLTFALGVLLAVAAVFMAQRGWRKLSLFLAAVVALASPVAALFLACCGFAHWVNSRLAGNGETGLRNRLGLEIAVASFFTAALVAVLFPGGGDEPYVWTSFVPAIFLTLLAAWLIPAQERLVRTGLLVYALALTATFLLDTPMGGNANRLGVLLVGAVFLCASWRFDSFPARRRVVAFAVLLPLLALWQFYPVIRDLDLVRGEPAVAAEFYSEVEEILGPKLALNPARVEVLPVASHWESARVPPEIPLARGWERQTDRRFNRLFYDGRLTPELYRKWLDELAVGFVAVPQAKLDYAAEAEADLIEGGLDFLREIPSGPDWKLYRVVGATPMVERPGRMTSLETDGFILELPRAGTYLVRVRATPYWTVESGSACVGATADGWTEVSAAGPGRVEVRARFGPAARLSEGRDCNP